MNNLRYIKSKQKIWAAINGVDIIGSKVALGEKCYTKHWEDNFFQPLNDDTLQEIRNRCAEEFGDGVHPGMIQALHSSIALTLNVMDYWRHREDRSELAVALRIPSRNISGISFEKNMPFLPESGEPWHVDIVFEYENGDCCAIENKFAEPFLIRRGEYGLREKQIQAYGGWAHLPAMHDMARNLCPADTTYRIFHPAQLIKHTMGLMNKYGNDKSRFRVVYLYYDGFGEEGYVHEKEIQAFADVAKQDGIRFQARTWQETILNLNDYPEARHIDYVNYLFSRYV